MKHHIKKITLYSLYLFMIFMPFGVFCDKHESDYPNRGTKLFGDYCDETKECGFLGAECAKNRKRCECQEHLPATNHIDKCGKTAGFNETCFFNEQCEAVDFRTECRNERCSCRIDIMSTVLNKDGNFDCKLN